MAQRPRDGEGTDDLSETQLRHLVSHVRRRADSARRTGAVRPVVDELIVMTSLHAGLRPQEICELSIADTPAIHGKAELHIRNRYTHSNRVIPIPQEVVFLFHRFVHLHRQGAQPNDLLLVSERGTPFSYMSLYSKVRRIGRESGITALCPTMLRHRFLQRLYQDVQDLRLVQQQAGHACLKSTARHVRPRYSPWQRCEACNRPVRPGDWERIDSGQLLCLNCLRDLRSH
jgi:integrase